MVVALLDVERFYAQVLPDDAGCLVWLGTTRNGYGRFWVGAKVYTAHRWLWEQENGEVPKGLQLDHTCRNRSCVNLEHLEVVTNKENKRRAANLQTHCKLGHPLTSNPCKIRYRWCATCRKKHALDYYYRNRKSA